MWKVKLEHGLTLNACPTLDAAMQYAKGYDGFVVITDGTTEIVGRFGVDAVENKTLPNGGVYDWTMRRDETHRSSRKKLV